MLKISDQLNTGYRVNYLQSLIRQRSVIIWKVRTPPTIVYVVNANRDSAII